MSDLTEKQRELLEFIADRIADKGEAPTVMEMMVEFDLKSEHSITDRLRRLEGKGYITRVPLRKRNIALTKRAEMVVNLHIQ